MWSIDSCQNKVSADQYHLSESRAQVSTHRGQVFFWSYPLTRYWFSNDRRLKFNFLKKIHMKYVVFYVRTIKILISNWPRTRKFSQLLQAGTTDAFDFYHHVHALVTFYVVTLSKFDSSVHAEAAGSILNLVYFDSWSWRSFVSTCDVFNCLFPLNVHNVIQLLSEVFSYSWLVCLLGFWLENTSLVKVGNPISDGIVFVFTLLNA